jgi:DNA-binding NarL/FixJ family response regulator
MVDHSAGRTAREIGASAPELGVAMSYLSTSTAAALRVLIVDDCESVRGRVRWALERAGMMVVGEAADGTEALTQAAARQPDVVLMDLHMPRMDGIQATRTLRLQQPGTRVVLWTGESDEQLASAVRDSGADFGLLKGVRTIELVAVLRRVCDGYPRSAPTAPPGTSASAAS